MSNVAIITARGGSKRLPRKNIRSFLGKPIISYSIEAAIRSGLFELVMVSTDDQEIAEISRQCGAEVPFLRSKATSDDHADTSDVMLEVLGQLITDKKLFEYACCIYPTAPLISDKSLIDGCELMKANNYKSVFPVCAFSYPIYRGLKIDASGRGTMIWPENQKVRSQDLPSAFYDAGQFYWLRTESFLKEKTILTDHTGLIILKEHQVQDIDTEGDWEMMELKYKLMKQQ